MWKSSFPNTTCLRDCPFSRAWFQLVCQRSIVDAKMELSVCFIGLYVYFCANIRLVLLLTALWSVLKFNVVMPLVCVVVFWKLALGRILCFHMNYMGFFPLGLLGMSLILWLESRWVWRLSNTGILSIDYFNPQTWKISPIFVFSTSFTIFFNFHYTDFFLHPWLNLF